MTFEHLGTGLNYVGGAFGDSLQVDSSAFVHNTTGVQVSGDGSIDQSTIANNTTGIAGSNLRLNLDNDTISHNATGFSVFGFGSSGQTDNTINADNTTDCANQTSAWEPVGSFNTNNLVGSSCPHGADGDIVWNGTALSALAENGGPTTSILPPAQAQGTAVRGICGSTGGMDQREFTMASPTLCDIGAVDHVVTTTPVAAGSPSSGQTIGFGTIPLGLDRVSSVSVSNLGAGLLYGYDASVSGLGFAVTSDTCSDAVLLNVQGFNGCFVNVTATPTASPQALTGTLTIHTSAGTLSYPLTAQGAPPLLPPTGVHGTPGNKRVTLGWTEPAAVAGRTLVRYEIDESTDGGANWNFAADVDAPATSATITGLTNATSYVFRMNVQDLDGDVSDWSTKSDAIKPVAPVHHTSLSAPHAATIGYGSATSETTKLTDTTTHTAIGGATVRLYSRAGSSGAFHLVANAHTAASGAASLPVHPHVTTQYEWKYTGTSGHASATSAIGTVRVAQVVHAAVTPSSMKHGKTAKIYGTVSPAANGKTVQLQRYASGHWHYAGSATIHTQKLPNGHRTVGFVIPFTAHSVGTRTLRVFRAATTTNISAVSHHLTLHVT